MVHPSRLFGCAWLGFDAVLVLGKELRHHPERARRELAARSAAAAGVWAATGARIYALEARLVGQEHSGSALVAENLAAFGVDPGAVHLEEQTCSTREEVCRALELWGDSRRPLALTAAYHVARVRALFAEEGRPVVVLPPEAFARRVSGPARDAILAALPDAAAWAHERRAERVLGGLEAAVRPLPLPMRRRLEIAAGAWLRRA